VLPEVVPAVVALVVLEPVVDELVPPDPVLPEVVPAVALVVLEPVVDEPVVDESVDAEPIVDAPVVDAPVDAEPVVDAPVEAAPVVDAPVEPIEAVVPAPVVDSVELVPPVPAPFEYGAASGSGLPQAAPRRTGSVSAARLTACFDLINVVLMGSATTIHDRRCPWDPSATCGMRKMAELRPS